MGLACHRGYHGEVSMRGRMLTAVLLVGLGLVWVGQGLGVLRGSSFMVDDTRWALAGGAAVLVGLALGISAWRSPRPP
jgi:ABC-type nickel/cobalt efflux system permease component RcnA